MVCEVYSGKLPLTVVNSASGDGGQSLTQNFKDISDSFGKVLASSGDSLGYLDAKVGNGLEVTANKLEPKLDGSTLTKSVSGLKVNATALAGDGLSTSADQLVVGAGDGIEVTAGLTKVKLDGSTLSRSGSGLKVSATGLAGDGLSTSGDQLVVGAGDGIEVAAGLTKVKLDGSTILRSGTGIKVSASALAGSGLTTSGDQLLVIKAAAVSDLSPTASLSDVITAVNDLLAKMRTAGLLSTT